MSSSVGHSALACGSIHNITSLSSFTSSASIILCFTTTPCNIILIIAILGDKKNVFKMSIFYKLILNSAIADLLIGTVADITSISFHFKEAMRIKIYPKDIKLLHLELFVLSNTSILSMALLCIDRIFALMKPIAYYRNSLSNRMSYLVLIATWVVSGLLVMPYFSVGYITYLGIFAFTTITIACVSLISVVYLYRTKFSVYCNFNKACNVVYEANKENSANKDQNSINVISISNIVESKKAKSETTKSKDLKQKTAEQKVNQSFIIMLMVFLLTYMPACCMTIYMNVCIECNCTVVQAFRDCVYLALLSGSLWRSLNFGYKITTLNKNIKEMLSFGHSSVRKKSTYQL
ncbi:uncharacterized protein LOC124818635 [Hydra vulgaris]|uniref:Uncharacterized protein LOC124818635 n=1 Tax=Hydra vulgaris TaxID=6087 RepID=A0ABM4BQP3_HYDVU